MANKPVFSRVDLARELARRRPDLHEEQALGILDLTLAIIAEQVTTGERVSLRGFGTFYKGTSRAIKAGRVFPDRILERDIPERPCLRFKQSRVVKATISGSRGRKKKAQT